MEEIEISSWVVLEAIQKTAKVVETVGDLQTGHMKSVFCVVEDDYLELVYLDTESNFLRRYENKEEFELALEKLKEEEEGEVSCAESHNFDDDFRDEDNMDDLASDEDSEGI
jgi:hypothetical protein